MILETIRRALKQIEKNVLIYTAVSLGEDSLSIEDKKLLSSMGVNLKPLLEKHPYYYRMFLLGRLTQLLGDYNSKKIKYKDFDSYLKKNQYPQLTTFEKTQYELSRQQTYSHLKNLSNRIKIDVENMIIEKIPRKKYLSIVKKEISEGILDRSIIGDIVLAIGNKTGDWSRDLGRIVDTEMNNIFQLGRAIEIQRLSGEEDPLVYKDVFPGACRHCIKLYLTRGIGSQPRVFRLSELVANGTNIGRKVADWLATLTGVHPFCRCTLRFLSKYHKWNPEKKRFTSDKEALENKIKELGLEGLVTVQVGEKEFKV